MADPAVRNIKIKTGVVKRLAKEKCMYRKEVIDMEAKIEKMKVDKKDEYDIKKQGEVLEESKIMIPDTKRRLKKAYDELTTLLKEKQELQENEEYIAAQKVLEDASQELGED